MRTSGVVFAACVTVFLLLTSVNAGSPRTKKTAVVDEEDNHPAAQEEKYRDVIKCNSCEKLVKGLAERAAKEPEGEIAPQGQNKKKTREMREKAAKTARALEFVEGGCDQEEGRDKVYCDQNLERFEDDLLQLVVHNGKHPKFANADDICLPVCEYKTSMKTQIEDIQSEIKRKYTKTLTEEVLSILQDYWYVWIGMFVTVLGAGLSLQLWLLRRQARAAVKRNKLR